MTAAPGFDLVAEVADAHAASTLAAADYLDVSFSSGGLAFTTKWQPNALAAVQARLTPLSQSVTLSGTVPRPWTVQVANSHELRPRLDGLRSQCRGRNADQRRELTRPQQRLRARPRSSR